MTPRKAFKNRLAKLNERIIEMGQEAEKLIEKTILALSQNDRNLAEEVIETDDKIDLMQLDIEKECASLIAQQQPIASDLRFILSVIKIVTDIERIADQCCDICKYSLGLEDGEWSKEEAHQRHIEKMAITARDMLTEALDGFVTKDIESIKAICKADDKIDEAFWKIWKELRAKMLEDKDFIKDGMHYLMMTKYLERIADHITNIAEWIYYSLTGSYVIHADIEKVIIEDTTKNSPK